MSKLSPAAQRVWSDAQDACPYVSKDRAAAIAAAALCAAVEQVLPAASPLDRAYWSPFAGQIRVEILAIAAELEAAG